MPALKSLEEQVKPLNSHQLQDGKVLVEKGLSYTSASQKDSWNPPATPQHHQFEHAPHPDSTSPEQDPKHSRPGVSG